MNGRKRLLVILFAACAIFLMPVPGARGDDYLCRYLGKLSVNKYDPDSISNPFGIYGSKYGDNLINPFSRYGSRYSPTSWRNPYATSAPKIYAADGTYLGKLSTNKYDPESISNPFGKYGSKYGDNLMNPFSRYGSKYSPYSWRNPYATSSPKIFSGEEGRCRLRP